MNYTIRSATADDVQHMRFAQDCTTDVRLRETAAPPIQISEAVMLKPLSVVAAA